MDKKNKVLLLISKIIFGFCFLTVAFFVGRIYEKINQENCIVTSSLPLQDAYCILNLEQISPIGIKGEIVSGDIRISAGNEIVSGSKSKFQIDTSDIYVKYDYDIPPGTKYYGSKRGSKVYPIENKSNLMKMSQKNLIFFKDLGQALKLGYKE